MPPAKATNADIYYRRLFKGILVTLAMAAILIGGAHLWFVSNARSVLKQMVTTSSKGTLRLQLSRFSFSPLSNEIGIGEADLLSTDSLRQPITYHIKFRQLRLQVSSFWPLLFQKKILLDSIHLNDPEVTVMQWRPDTAAKDETDDLSIPQQMGKLYNSMLNGLEDFGIRRISLTNAKVSLVNKMKPGKEPVTISRLYLDLVRTLDNGGQRDVFIPNKQTVDLHTRDQNIALPSGRHRLAFKTFRLELFRKRIQLDSCTVTATTTDSSKSNYSIFFRKLLLVGVDFDAMYRHNLVKADSVYCESPLFNINIDTEARGKGGKGGGRPDPNKIIRELTGDLDLSFVGVKSAGIHINISGKKDRSLFNSNQDDFEMRGLRINGDSSRPVVVQRFDMLVRDYHLYNEDSSAAYTFDSIHFRNNQVVLNNFTMRTHRGLRNRDFRIPYFALTGLDWYALIFDQSLVARQAVLTNPVIAFTTGGGKGRKKKGNLFQSLHTLDDLVTLQKLHIINGKVALQLGAATALNLEQVNLSLSSDKLMNSNNSQGLRRAVDRFSFSTGTIRHKNSTAHLVNARTTPANLIQADRLSVQSSNPGIKATINGITINNLMLDDATENVVLDGLQWRNATLALDALAKGGSGKGGGSLLLKNISGGNTSLRFSKGKMIVTSYFETLRLQSLSKKGAAPPRLEGLIVKGRDASVVSPPLNLQARDYSINSSGVSTVGGLELQQVKGQDSVFVKAPQLSFIADLNGLLNKEAQLSDLTLQRPVIRITKRGAKGDRTAAVKPSFRIDQFRAVEPDLQVRLYRQDSLSLMRLQPSDGSSLAASGIVLNKEGLRLDHLSLNASNATFVRTGGAVMGMEKGRANIRLSDISIGTKEGKPQWSALVDSLVLQNPNNMVFGKRKSKLITEQLSLGNLRLSSDAVMDMDKLMKFNVTVWLQTATGQFADSTTTLKWYNASYNAEKRLLSLDSFRYYPTRSLDSVLVNTIYQTDYITFHSGPIRLSDFNLEQYKIDSSILGNTLSITRPAITIFRDKAPPFKARQLKPLPVDMLKSIPLPISVKKVLLSEGLLSYTERHAKTRAEGTLVLSHLNASLANVRNRNLHSTDSLQLFLRAFLMDSAELDLRVKESYTDTLSGFLMTLRLKPTTLSFLNPVLAPLSNVIIRSGTIDSLHLRAIGTEDVAVGTMKMYYRNLRIKLVKGGDETQSSTLTKVVSFLANTFLIKKNNSGRTGFVYYERQKDRSFFNYLIRTTFSGMASSIGVKKNSKYKKKYRKLIEDRNLPRLDFE